ncbi:MAG: hypothetical protein QXV17_13045 [Candidatus Micrarchaeaceae archaeon]
MEGNPIEKRELDFIIQPLKEKPEEEALRQTKEINAEAGGEEAQETTPTSGFKEEEEGEEEEEKEEEKEHITGTNLVAQLNELGLDVLLFDAIKAQHLDEEDKQELNDAWNALFEKYGVKSEIITHPIGRVIVANLKAVAKKKDDIIRALKERKQKQQIQGV